VEQPGQPVRRLNRNPESFKIRARRTNAARSFLLAPADLARQSNLCSIPAKVRALLNELNGALSID
jgi:hypothetical protein